MNPALSMTCVWLFLSGLALAVPSADAQQPAKPGRRSHLDVVFSGSLFQSANRNDATAALRVWTDTLGRRRGIEVSSNIQVVDEMGELRAKLASGRISLAAIDAVEYLKLADISDMEPVFYALRTGGDGLQRYLLLTRADSGITSLAELRGKSLILNASTKANLGQLWLDSTLRAARLEPSARLFRNVETVQKGSAAILPVFFGKADVAVVDQSTYEVTREMNPQVGMKLRILSSSPSLVETVICVSRKHEYHQELLDGLRDLHLDAEGRQALLVFRFSRLMPFAKNTIDEVRDLWRKSETATASAGKSGVTP